MQFDEAIQNFRSIGISIFLGAPTDTQARCIGILKCIDLLVSKYSEMEKVKPKGKTPRASGARAVMGKWGTFANDVNSNGSGAGGEKKSRRVIETVRRSVFSSSSGGCFSII